MLGGTVRVRGGSCAFGSVTIDGIVLWSGPMTQTAWTEIPITNGVPAGNHTLIFFARYGAPSCPLRFDNVTLVTAAP
jgi:hypothetical protein